MGSNVPWKAGHATAALVFLAAWLGPSCTGKTSTSQTSDDDADVDADTDSDTDTDTDTDTDSDADTDTQSLLVKLGEATVNPGVDFVGFEELQLVDESGYGAVVCQIRYDVLSTATHEVCPGCSWAFEVEVSNAAVLYDIGSACLAGYGLDTSNVSTLDGTQMTYGYNPDFVGHAKILMTEVSGKWAPATYANYDELTGEFTYDWEDGLIAY